MSDQYSTRLGPGIHKVSTIQDPIADSAFRIYTQKKENDALYYLTFVGVNSTTPSTNRVFTSSGLSFNPYRNRYSINSTVRNTTHDLLLLYQVKKYDI
jgi:hypothetical protein